MFNTVLSAVILILFPALLVLRRYTRSRYRAQVERLQETVTGLQEELAVLEDRVDTIPTRAERDAGAEAVEIVAAPASIEKGEVPAVRGGATLETSVKPDIVSRLSGFEIIRAVELAHGRRAVTGVEEIRKRLEEAYGGSSLRPHFVQPIKLAQMKATVGGRQKLEAFDFGEWLRERNEGKESAEDEWNQMKTRASASVH